MADRFAGSRTAVAKIPHIAADGAVAVGGAAAIKGNGERSGTTDWRGADHCLGCFVGDHRCGDDHRGADFTGLSFAVGDGQSGGKSAGRGVGMGDLGAGG